MVRLVYRVSGVADDNAKMTKWTVQMREESEDDNKDGQAQGSGKRRWRVEDVQKEKGREQRKIGHKKKRRS